MQGGDRNDGNGNREHQRMNPVMNKKQLSKFGMDAVLFP